MIDDDGLTVIENDDGSLTIGWDRCDSRWSVLNTMTSEQISAMILEQAKLYLSKNNE